MWKRLTVRLPRGRLSIREENVWSRDVSVPGRAARRQTGCNCAAMSYEASAGFSSQGGVSSAPTEAAAAWECRALLQLFVCSVTEKVTGFNLR